jgi:hypothetical protein
VNQTNHFFNLGYGWLCKHCSAEDAERSQQQRATGGLALPNPAPESRQSGLALATWTTPSRCALACPRCGIEETLTNA